MKRHEEVSILLIDDDELDTEVFRRGLIKKNLSYSLHIARDGIEGLEILRGQEGKTKLPKPYIILLDMNMPRMNGIEFLSELRSDPELSSSLVFMLTTSMNQEDLSIAYRHNIAGYIIKNDICDGFLSAIDMLDSYCKTVRIET